MSKKHALVVGNERRKVARPQPPMQDKRTKRQRTRAAVKQAAIKEGK